MPVTPSVPETPVTPVFLRDESFKCTLSLHWELEGKVQVARFSGSKDRILYGLLRISKGSAGEDAACILWSQPVNQGEDPRP